MKKQTEDKILEFVKEYYLQAEIAVPFNPSAEVIVNLAEDGWVDKEGNWVTGGKIYSDIRGIDANYVKYPNYYRRYVNSENLTDFEDAMAMYEMTKLIRKVYEIEKENE